MVGTDQMDQLWLAGVYPPSFPAKSDRAAAAWRKAYITTFLERDNPSFGFSIQLSHRRGAGGDDGDGDPASGGDRKRGDLQGGEVVMAEAPF